MRLEATWERVCSHLAMRANVFRVTHTLICSESAESLSCPLNSDIQHITPYCSAVLHYITFDPCQHEPFCHFPQKLSAGGLIYTCLHELMKTGMRSLNQ